MESIYKQVSTILGASAGHGMDHIIAVIDNLNKMISSHGHLTQNQITIISLAALLHDVDDHKFFKGTQNAKEILHDSNFKEFVVEVLFCVDCVGYSSNQNTFPHQVPSVFDKHGFHRDFFNETQNFHDDDLWILYPRFADRLEAIDLNRALEFGRSRNRLDFNDFTPKIFFDSDFDKIDFSQLEREYILRGCKAHPNRNTSMDHVYEKCMNLFKMDTKNVWCEHEIIHRFLLLKKDIILFWHSG